jgi:hypothetical protein
VQAIELDERVFIVIVKNGPETTGNFLAAILPVVEVRISGKLSVRFECEGPGDHIYKSFFLRNLRMSPICYSVRCWQAFPSYSIVCA